MASPLSLGAMVVGCLVALLALVVEAIRDEGLGLRALAIASGLLFFMVIARLAGLLREVHRGTALLRAEQAKLARSERQLAQAEQLAHLGSWQRDLRTGEVTLSEGLSRRLGIAPDAEAGWERLMEAVHPDDRHLVRTTLDRALADHEPFGFDLRFTEADGADRIHHMSGAVLVDLEGVPLALTATSQEVTDRRRAETLLRESEDRFRSIFATARVGEAAASLDGKFFQVNRAWCDMLGYSEQDLLTLGWQAISHPDELEIDRRNVQRLLAGETSHFEREKRHVRKDGTTMDSLVSVALIRDEGGQPLYFVALIQDITERRDAERRLRGTLGKLQEINRERQMLMKRLVRVQEEERKRIASDIHDDTIQVMTAAGIRLEMLRRRLSRPEDVASIERVEETVALATDRLRELLFELHPPALDRSGLTPAVRQYLEQARQETGIEFDLDGGISNEVPLEVATICYRIAREALANVRKHARAKKVTVLLHMREGGVWGRVSDDGVGFEPGAERPRWMPGHLGISEMEERGRMAGGWCRVLSALGTGTTVEFWIPIRTREESDEDGLPEWSTS